ncbi:MAG: KdsC family phosphatase [Phycisphaerales bacterium]
MTRRSDIASLDDRLAAVRLLVLDVDGVLTNGRIEFDADGRETKSFHVRDGLAMKAWMRSGRHLAIITGRASLAVTARMTELEVPFVIQGSHDKGVALERLLSETGVSAGDTAAIGDDLTDLPLLRMIGVPIAVADAAPEVREAAAWVMDERGGDAVARVAIERMMRLSGAWDSVVSRYDSAGERAGARSG